MANESPFFQTRVECPVCKSLNEFETVKVGAYVESGRDADFCPTGIKWRFPRYQEFNPLVFFTATCPSCLYTREMNNNFKDWKNDNNFKTYKLKIIKDKHLEQLSQSDSALKQLGAGIDLTRQPNESAIIKLHLAIFDELLSERFSKLDLARWYLRIAWVYRELGSSESPNTSFLKSTMIEIESKYNLLWQTIESLTEHSAVFRKHLEAQFETDKISAELKAQMLPFKGRFAENLTSLNANVDSTVQQFKLIEKVLEEYKTATLGTKESSGGTGAGNSSAFSDFMLPLKKKWDCIAANEHQALGKAVEYYKKAFEESKDIAAGNQQIQASYLIAELSRRIGLHDQAKEFFASTIKHGQEFIYRHREDKAQTALARKILELAIDQNKIMKSNIESR